MLIWHHWRLSIHFSGKCINQRTKIYTNKQLSRIKSTVKKSWLDHIKLKYGVKLQTWYSNKLKILLSFFVQKRQNYSLHSDMDLLYTVLVVVYRTKIHTLTQVLPLKVDFIVLSNGWAWTNVVKMTVTVNWFHGIFRWCWNSSLPFLKRGFWSKIVTTTM